MELRRLRARRLVGGSWARVSLQYILFVEKAHLYLLCGKCTRGRTNVDAFRRAKGELYPTRENNARHVLG